MVKFNLLVFLLFLISPSWAQNKYAVFYQFKPQEVFSLENPQQYLSAKALQNRQKEGIALDSLDLPVSTRYLKQIESSVNEVIYSTKWLNASIVKTNEEGVQKLKSLPFVKEVRLVAPGSSISTQKVIRKKWDSLDHALHLNPNQRLNSYKVQNELLGIDKMHEKGLQGKGVTIAVFDAGFPGVDQIKGFQHLFTQNKIVGTRDFVQTNNSSVYYGNQHGTNVLSLISAFDQDLLIAGAHQANVILCITEDVNSEFTIEEYNWARAAEYADSLGTNIIQSSLGYWDFDDPTMDYTLKDLDGKTAIVSRAASIASQKGILVVVSAGNYGSKGVSSITPPADAASILSVGALTPALTLSNFSSKGPTVDQRIKPELVAIGSNVFLLRSTGQLQTGNGTSFSAPQITALAAGIMEAKPDLKKEELIQAFLKTATLSNAPNNEWGYGIPNYEKIMKILIQEDEEIPVVIPKIYPNPISNDYGLYIEENEVFELSVKLLDVRGVVIYKEDAKRNSLKEPFYLPLRNVPSGFYWIEMDMGTSIKRTRLIKN
jgi:serine protease AprX